MALRKIIVAASRLLSVVGFSLQGRVILVIMLVGSLESVWQPLRILNWRWMLMAQVVLLLFLQGLFDLDHIAIWLHAVGALLVDEEVLLVINIVLV